MVVQGSLLERNRGSGVFAIFALLATLATIAIVIATPAPAGLVEYPVVAFFAAIAAHYGWWKPRETKAELRVDDEGVHVDGKLVRKRADLHRAVILPRDKKPPIVELQGIKTAIRVVVPTTEDAQKFVRTLGLDARQGMTMSGAVTIGTDGIAVKYGRRFIPWSDVVDLERMAPPQNETVSRGFLVHTRTGETIRVLTIDDRFRDGAYEGDHLFDAACAARGAAHKREPTVARVSLLRGGRSVRDWIAALRAERDGYRVAATMSEDDLVRTLEDPTAPEEVRAGAAARLAALGKDDQRRMRIRVAAEGVAEPRLRVAIDAALADDDEALERALSELAQRP